MSTRYVAADGDRLGVWLSNQRTLYKDGGLSAERISQLEDLGVVWDQFEYAWDRYLAAVRAFREEHGHQRIPKSYTDADGLRLNIWLRNQIRARREGKLSAERIAALDAIGVVWDARKKTGPRMKDPPKRTETPEAEVEP